VLFTQSDFSSIFWAEGFLARFLAQTIPFSEYWRMLGTNIIHDKKIFPRFLLHKITLQCIVIIFGVDISGQLFLHF